MQNADRPNQNLATDIVRFYKVSSIERPQNQMPNDAVSLAMMHNPDSFASFPAGMAPLAVAGHTHGGQVRVPFTPDWSLLALLSDDEVTVAGWIDAYGQPGNHLYVNRGIGFSVAPVRLACVPELTLFTLRDSR